MRAASIKRRLLVNPMLAMRYANTKRVSIQMRYVLDGVTQLVAMSPEPGIWRPDPELDGDESLAIKVSRHLQALDTVPEVEAALLELARLQFIVVPDRTCIVIAAALVSRSTDAKNGGMSVGKPHKGESTADYKERTRVHQAAMRAQGSLMLAVPGGGIAAPLAGEALAQALRATLMVVHPEPTDEMLTQTLTQAATQALTGELTQPPLDTAVLGYADAPSHAVAAAVLKALPEGGTAAATATCAPARPDANPEPNPSTNPAPNPEVVASAAPAPAVDPAEAILLADAVRLGEAAANKNSFNREERNAAPGFFEGYLRAGYTASQLGTLIATAPKRCNGAAWYGSGPLVKAYGTPTAAREAHRDATPAATHPRLEENPGWKKLGADKVMHILTFLKAMDAEPAPRARTFCTYKGMWSQEYDLVRARYPEVNDMAEWRPEQRSAAG